MSQRLPDYDAMREAQARSQQADRIGPDEYGNYINHELAAEVKAEIAAIYASLEPKP